MKFNLGDFVHTMEHGIQKAFGIVVKVDGEMHDVLKVADGAITVVQNVPGVADAAAASVPEAGGAGTHVIYPLDEAEPAEDQAADETPTPVKATKAAK